jgi:hypothetical protein
VPLEGRGSLPFVDLHQQALFLHAVRALLDVDAVDGRVVVTVGPDQRDAVVAALAHADLPVLVEEPRTWWRSVAGRVELVLHDPLCPLVPASFIAACLREAGTDQDTDEDTDQDSDEDSDRGALVAFRPVTDTIKTVVEDHIVDTLDRDLFGIVASPVVFGLDGDDPVLRDAGPPTEDFAVLATWLRARGPVLLHKAPSLGRRVDDASAVNLLECMDEMARSVRES